MRRTGGSIFFDDWEERGPCSATLRECLIFSCLDYPNSLSLCGFPPYSISIFHPIARLKIKVLPEFFSCSKGLMSPHCPAGPMGPCGLSGLSRLQPHVCACTPVFDSLSRWMLFHAPAPSHIILPPSSLPLLPSPLLSQPSAHQPLFSCRDRILPRLMFQASFRNHLLTSLS